MSKATCRNSTRGGGQKLQLIRSEKNNGNPSIPRNIGIRFSRGEYLTFIDSDDAVTPTALDELFKITLDFDVDIICCRRQYKIPPEVFINNLQNISQYMEDSPAFVKKVMNESNDFIARVKNFADRKYFSGSYNYLFRRNVITRNNIEFPNLKMGEDRIFNFYAVCMAKNIVFAPNCFYLYRLTPNSACREKLPVEGRIKRWGKTIVQAIGLLDNFMNKFESLRNNPEYKYMIFESFAKHYMPLDVYLKASSYLIDSLIRQELESVKDKTALTAFIFNRMNIFNLQLNQSNAIINQMNAHIQKQNQVIQQLQAQIQSLQAK